MNIFISWSGERSLHIAEGLRDWLPDVLPDAIPFMSSKDIDRGTDWRSKIRGQLDDTSIGVICLTPDNLAAPWLLFESGALSKNEGRVFTYLYDLDPSQVEEPMSQYQHTLTTKGDTSRLVMDINKMSNEPREEERVRRSFEAFWHDLEASLKSVPKSDDVQEPTRSDSEILREILGLVRIIPELDRSISVPINVQTAGRNTAPHSAREIRSSRALYSLLRRQGYDLPIQMWNRLYPTNEEPEWPEPDEESHEEDEPPTAPR